MKTTWTITVADASGGRIALPKGFKSEGEALRKADEINQACPQLKARVERSDAA